MRYASVLYRDYVDNSLFTPGAGENNGEFYLPYVKLRARFLAAGIDLLHIPYAGGAPATNDLLAGHINLMFNNPTQSLPYIKAGQVRGLAVTGLERNPLTPDLPTVAELGYPGFDVGTWFALWAPAGTAPEIIRTLQAAIAKVAHQPDVLERLAANGLRSIGGTSDELARIMKSDHETWGQVIRDGNIRIE